MNEAEKLPGEKLPEAGYRIERIYALKQSYEVVDVGRLESPAEGMITLKWDWRLIDSSESESAIDVRLALTVEGTSERPDIVEVDLVGRFELLGKQQSIALEPFVTTSAPAILFPYLRERINSLTSYGPYSRYVLPITNVLNLMKRMDYQKSSGAQQLLWERGKAAE